MNHRTPLLRLAVPNYVALLSGVLTGIVDVAWVARLGPSPVAAVAVATGVENALLGIVLLISGGVTVRLAAALGAGDTHTGRDRPGGATAGGATAGGEAGALAVIRAGWRLYLVITPVVVLAGTALRGTLAGAFLADPGAARLAGAYLAVLFPGVAIFYAQQVVDAIFAGRGDTRTPMRLALTANALILVLDPLLIYGAGLGVTGAALATAAGRAVALTGGLVRLHRGRPGGRLRPDAALPVRAVARTGAPIAGDFLVRMAGALVLLAVVGRHGVAAVAAYGIGLKVLYFATMGFYAIRNAATIHTPRTLSARPGQRAAIGRQVLTLALVAGIGASALFAGFAPLIMRLFTADRAVAAAGVLFLRCVGGYLVPIAAVIGLAGFLMAAGRGARLFAVTVAGTALQTLLALWLPARLGLPGVWLAMALAAVFQLLLVLASANLRDHPAAAAEGGGPVGTEAVKPAVSRSRRSAGDRPERAPR
ncbi:Multidrug resistance protein mdtK [Actinoplanes sp. SE50]|uniref:MATE family efflux transporter n=1 Tax=unclassified Actinoplanes TaxID=2626549 RepID=UPI00023EBB14|nr:MULTISPECIES: MATE family efflux transporter [unclassified Actinoplanes]AEV82306.1 Multidrug resistance protein mdtK [Actinoplanes sp. SE50/110]ATO80703.1 Multidrug resistance protein mdtK [Actinoplanes sp. SE50]SLL98110.1 Multidrug resistance protein mdtK [Actinoplanes sp. SE50/110]